MPEPSAGPVTFLDHAEAFTAPAIQFLRDGGPTIWAIAALSVITVALILWKTWRLALIGAWSRGRARDAVAAYEDGRPAEARAIVAGRRGLRSRCVHAALHARETYDEEAAREDATRYARREIENASGGLRPLELIATIAPLLGLLGTVLGMIAAFQALQEAGARADPATLAGGIWEALLTTAAGMAVAIPASMAHAWFEGIIDSMGADVEDGVSRIFVTGHRKRNVASLAAAAE
ncbi:MotA/TolQ/ExbB proton channel family protein [Tropicimonas sp.]|uniref:MotA/TolQ/ExbB proton channel family protein n=1 Tax=Tropicimonas sp. TaxID=2067044 RepID=UPI003A8BB048